MSYFKGLASDVVGVLLLGAEGCSEAASVPWLRDATADEQRLFIEHCRAPLLKAKRLKRAEDFDYTELAVDGTGRPFWLKAVLDHPALSPLIRHQAVEYCRIVRLGEL